MYNYYDYNRLLEEHSSAKAKMIVGIVFTAIAAVLSYVWLLLIIDDDDFAPFILFVLPAWGVGIPFLITGIVNTIKSNRNITLAKKGMPVGYDVPVHPPVYAQPPVMPAAPAQPPVYAQPPVTPVAPAQPPVYAQPPVAPVAPAQPPVYAQPQTETVQPAQPVAEVQDEEVVNNDSDI